MFRILSITILHHQVLGNTHLNFCQNGDQDDMLGELYTSVVIGTNGIGKSHLMRSIADIFSYLDSLSREAEVIKNIPEFKFDVRYRMDDSEYEFANFREVEPVGGKRRVAKTHLFKKNDVDVGVGMMAIPSRIIASTMTVTDKFTTVMQGRYIYKGIRNENSPNTTGTRTMIRKTVSGLLHSLDVKEGFRQELTDLLEKMGLRPHLEVSYTLRYKDVFLNTEMTPERLCHIFDNQGDYFKKRKSPIWGTSNFQKMRQNGNTLFVVSNFLRTLAEENKNEKRVYLNYNVLEDPDRINRDKEALEALSALDILSFPSLRIYKRDTEFAFENSSSGETHLLCQLIGIMSDIEHNSLVLIDEPENSSHPSWQVNYINWLKSIFRLYADSHFVMATHSHFLLTDLRPESSDIIALVRDDENQLKDSSDGVNTFNWSVDDILYRVFQVRNTRNYVFEGKVVDLYHMVSNREQDKAKIRGLIEELSAYRLNDADPMMKLINIAKDYVESV